MNKGSQKERKSTVSSKRKRSKTDLEDVDDDEPKIKKVKLSALGEKPSDRRKKWLEGFQLRREARKRKREEEATERKRKEEERTKPLDCCECDKGVGKIKSECEDCQYLLCPSCTKKHNKEECPFNDEDQSICDCCQKYRYHTDVYNCLLCGESACDDCVYETECSEGRGEDGHDYGG
ncbi:MAG: hypothetical protein ACTSUE_04200 [Promethearchaeota archaeon]